MIYLKKKLFALQHKFRILENVYKKKRIYDNLDKCDYFFKLLHP